MQLACRRGHDTGTALASPGEQFRWCLQVFNIRLHVIEPRACECLYKHQASISTLSGLGVMHRVQYVSALQPNSAGSLYYCGPVSQQVSEHPALQSNTDACAREPHHFSENLHDIIQLHCFAICADQGVVARGIGLEPLLDHAAVDSHGLPRLVAHVAGYDEGVEGAQHRLHPLQQVP